MQFERPKTQRTHIQAIDGVTRKSKTITVYNCTPEEVIDRVKQWNVSAKAEARRRLRQPA